MKDLEEAVPLMEQSLEHYRKLADLTKEHYYYANSMQTAQRRIPIGGMTGITRHGENCWYIMKKSWRTSSPILLC